MTGILSPWWGGGTHQQTLPGSLVRRDRKGKKHMRMPSFVVFFIDFPIKNTFIQKLFYKTIPNEENLCHKIKYAIKKQK